MTQSVRDKLLDVGKMVKPKNSSPTVEFEKPYSHTDIKTGNRYMIPMKDRADFYTTYKKAYINNEILDISESKNILSHVIIPFKIDCVRKNVTRDMILDLVKSLYYIIDNGKVMKEEGRGSNCCVTYNNEELYFHFPDMYWYWRECCGITKTSIHKNLVMMQGFKWYKYFDKSFYNESTDVPMYGSTNRPRRLSFCCVLDGNDVIINSLSDCFERVIEKLEEQMFYNRDNDDIIDEYMLPILLSTHISPTTKKLFYEKGDPISESVILYNVNSFKKRDAPEIDKSIENKINPLDLFPMWKAKRIHSISEWKRMGEAIYNYYDGSEEGFEVWLSETNKILIRYLGEGNNKPKYLQGDKVGLAEKFYYSFLPNRIDALDAAYAARADNNKAYNKYDAKQCKKSMIDSLSGFNIDGAKALWDCFKLDFMCEVISNTRHDWYYFDPVRNRLIRDNGNVMLMKTILTKFRRKFFQMKLEVMARKAETDDDEDLAKLDLVIAKIGNMDSNLCKSGYLNGIIKIAAIWFHRDGLGELLNSNVELTCVRSGVMVATKNDVIIRPGRPQDYLARETSATYRSLSWDHPLVSRMMYWSAQTFTDPEMVDYWWKLNASRLRGGNPDKIIVFLYGPLGNNGKTTWINTIKRVWGGLFSKATMVYLTTEERSPNAPNDILAKVSSSRWFVCEEAEVGGNSLKGGKMKDLSGGGSQYVRVSHQPEGKEVSIQFLIMIATNEMPESSTKCKATRNRFVVIKFKNIWEIPENAPMTLEEQFARGIFIIDPKFDEQVETFGDAYLWITTQYYDRYLKEGLRNYPDAVRKANKEYWDEKDMFSSFISEKIDFTGNVKDRVHVSDMQDLFNDWYMIAYPRTRPPSRPKLIEELSRKWEKPEDNYFSKIKIKKSSSSGGGSGNYGCEPRNPYAENFGAPRGIPI